MIVTVCLNPCIDRALAIERFAYGGLNRVLAKSEEGGGKGVNVALALRELGEEAVCTGFMPERGGEPILQKLGPTGAAFVQVPGQVRVNTKVRSREDGMVTEINEQGPAVGKADFARLLEKVAALCRSADYLVLTGSAPPGCPGDAYARLANAAAIPFALDAGGELLLRGLKAGPLLIKPNRFELESALDRPLPTHQDILAGARELAGEGMAAVSLGAEGAVFSYRGEGYFAPRVPIEALSTVGAGDCMVAGLLYGLMKNYAAAEVFRCGVAAGTAGCMTPGTGLLRRQDFLEAVEKVEVQLLHMEENGKNRVTPPVERGQHG